MTDKKNKALQLAELRDSIVSAIQENKGNEIVTIDLTEVEGAPADCYVICEGTSNVHVKGIADQVQSNVWEDLNLKPNHTEGKVYAQWVLLDYFDVVVHVFKPEIRSFYDLEGMWADGKFEAIESNEVNHSL